MINKTLWYLLVIVALFLIGVYIFTDLVIYICISLVLATVLRPMTNFIHRIYIFHTHIPRIIAIIFAFSSVVLLIILFMQLFIPLIIDEINVISNISFDVVYDDLSQSVSVLDQFLIEHNLIPEHHQGIKVRMKLAIIEFLKGINFGNIINNLVAITEGIFISVLTIGFITFFLLLDNGIITRLIISIVPNQYFELFISAISKIEKLLFNYLIGLLFQMAAIFTIAGIGLSIFDIKYALTIAAFAALANIVPYIGPILGSIFGVFVGVSTSGFFAFNDFTSVLMIKILSVFAVVHAIDNFLLQPLIFSKSVKVHPLEIFLVIFAAASIAGVAGMIAAIPVYTIIRVSVIETRNGFNSYQIFQISK